MCYPSYLYMPLLRNTSRLASADTLYVASSPLSTDQARDPSSDASHPLGRCCPPLCEAGTHQGSGSADKYMHFVVCKRMLAALDEKLQVQLTSTRVSQCWKSQLGCLKCARMCALLLTTNCKLTDACSTPPVLPAALRGPTGTAAVRSPGQRVPADPLSALALRCQSDPAGNQRHTERQRFEKRLRCCVFKGSHNSSGATSLVAPASSTAQSTVLLPWRAHAHPRTLAVRDPAVHSLR